MLCDRPVSLIREGIEVIGACGSCSKCRAVRRRDVIGRAVAEGRDPACQGGTFMTLTYGYDRRYAAKLTHPHAYKLHYEDVQKYLKRIRRRLIPPSNTQRYRLRYLVAGEYGTLGGRAHWHVLAWWHSEVPKYSTEKCWKDDPFWSEGHTNWRKAGALDVAYLAKYATKFEVDEKTETCFHGSFRPLIGGYFFRQWAELHVAAGLALTQGRKYQIEGSRTKTGKLFDYWMTPAAARIVVKAYLAAWEKRFPGTHPPYSRIVEKVLDDEAKPRMEKLRDAMVMERHAVGGEITSRRRTAKKPTEPPPHGYEFWFDDSRLVFVAVAGDGRPELYWNTSRWSTKLRPRKAGLGDRTSPLTGVGDTVPDLPGEAPREYRKPADVPDFEPGQALDLSKRRKRPGERERYASRKAQQYHQQMLAVRMERVADAMKRFRDDPSS